MCRLVAEETPMLRRSLLLAVPAVARAQGWPTRPVRIVVPFTPGGSNDAMARPLAERLQAVFGQPFVIENRPGAGSAVGVQYVTQSAPDGHTLLVTTSSVAAIAPVQRLAFDAARDLDGIALIASAPLAVFVPPNTRFAELRALVAEARRRPGEIPYASSGPGSTVHLMTELFCLRAGVRLQHIPYRGTAGALTDLVAGRVDAMFTTFASASGQLRGGLLKVLAHCGERAPEGQPPAPTVREQGVDYTGGIWWGLFAPRGLDPALRARLNTAVNAAVAEPGFARILASEAATPGALGAEGFQQMIRDEQRAMLEVVTAARITAD
jgi:tripartite-type tricarboxylate transporter receptor subunit TctC